MRDIKFRIWDGAKNEWLASSNKDALCHIMVLR
nr:MAG TPA: YopX protein [Caudoviricetes sp.]